MHSGKITIKVCGMCDTEKLLQLSELDIDMLGFIFYPKSKRYVEAKIDSDDLLKIRPEISKVGVFVDSSSNEIIEIARKWNLETLQLHGSETPELCLKMKQEGHTVIKAFNLTVENDFNKYEQVCDYFLFDTPTEQYGGSGKKFDWNLLEKYNGTLPFILSGGIGPEDYEEILSIRHPQFAGIDINSKFEINPGIKDVDKVKEFVIRIREQELNIK